MGNWNRIDPSIAAASSEAIPALDSATCCPKTGPKFDHDAEITPDMNAPTAADGELRNRATISRLTSFSGAGDWAFDMAVGMTASA